MTSLAPGLRREVEYNHFSLNVLSVKGKCMQSDDTQTPSPKPILWMVIPCYNEEAVLPETSGTFLSELSGLISAEIVSDKSSILFVDDGSSDSTWTIIERLSNDDAHFRGISLSRNRGHQNALLAGLMEARKYCDVSISLHCDGQDDISAVSKMIEKYLDGSDVVYGVRNDRSTDTFFKRMTAEAFYGMMKEMGVDTVFNHADYRLLSLAALDGLSEYGESNLFLRGMVPLIGLPSSTVEYSRAARVAGDSHYPLRKMIALAVDGITSLSIKPIHLISAAGAVIGLVGLLGTFWAILSYFSGATVSGWTSTICVILFLGGTQLLSLGVIGEYVGKAYLETKSRPRYLIEKRTYESNRRNLRG